MRNNADRKIEALKELIDAGLISIQQSKALLELESMSFIAKSSFPNSSFQRDSVWYQNEIDKLDPAAHWQYDTVSLTPVPFTYLYYHSNGTKLSLSFKPGQGRAEVLYNHLTKLGSDLNAPLEKQAEDLMYGSHKEWLWVGQGPNYLVIKNIRTGHEINYSISEYAMGTDFKVVFRDFLELEQDRSSTKVHQHEYVNQGFNSIVMACKHCGTLKSSGEAER